MDEKDLRSLKSESDEEMAVESADNEEEEEGEEDEDQVEGEECVSLEADEEPSEEPSDEESNEQEEEQDDEEEEEEQEPEETTDDVEDDDDIVNAASADDASFIDDVVASSGEVLKPKPRAMFSNIENPNYMSMLHLRDNGYSYLRYTADGGKPMDFNVKDDGDWKTSKKLIATSTPGATWKAFYYVAPTAKIAPTAKKQKKKNRGKAFAPGFTTGSDNEEDTVETDARRSAKSSSATLPSKKKVSKTETPRMKSPAKTNSSKKTKAGKHGSVSTKAASSRKIPEKGTPKGKGTKNPGKISTPKKKRGKNKVGDSASSGGYGQVGQSSPGKGKVIMLDFDSDDDPLDLDNEEAYAKAVAEVKKESKEGRKPLSICVSPPFASVTKGHAYYYVTFPKPGKLFILKPDWYRINISICHKRRKLVNPKLNDDGDWIDTIHIYHVRKNEYGAESLYRKTNSNNTIDLIAFIHAVPLDDMESFDKLLTYRLKYFFDVCRKRRTNATGMNALQFIRDLPTGDTGGIGRWALNRAKGDVEKAAELITDDMEEYYGGGHSLQYDVPLNRYMVDFDIKTFLDDYLGTTSWDDLSEEDKKKCYKDYPKRSLPDWDTIERESY